MKFEYWTMRKSMYDLRKHFQFSHKSCSKLQTKLQHGCPNFYASNTLVLTIGMNITIITMITIVTNFNIILHQEYAGSYWGDEPAPTSKVYCSHLSSGWSSKVVVVLDYWGFGLQLDGFLRCNIFLYFRMNSSIVANLKHAFGGTSRDLVSC